MTDIENEERVRLTGDLPELGLHRGDLGVVCSMWFQPSTVVEVEFKPVASGFPVRALLMPSQIKKNSGGSTS